MNIQNAKYVKERHGQIVGEENECIKATIDGVETFVGLSLANRHYAEIMKQVEAGELTIQEADSE